MNKALLMLMIVASSLVGCTTYNTTPAPTATTTTYTRSTPVVPAATRTSVSTTSTSY
jgi:hypothetical protein